MLRIMTFEVMIIPKLMAFIWVLLTIAIISISYEQFIFVDPFNNDNIGSSEIWSFILSSVVGILFTRIVCEILVVPFKIHEALQLSIHKEEEF